jgi:hypothetical protein
VAPKINVGGVFRELENREANHANNKRPAQQGSGSGVGAFVLRHGRKIPVAAPDKSIFIYDIGFTIYVVHRQSSAPRKSYIVNQKFFETAFQSITFQNALR